MGDSIIGIGLSGLAAAQAGLVTTGHNISNVNTPGYSRQQTLQSTALPLFTGGGYVGQGVNVDTVRRVYSDFLAARTTRTQSEASQLDTLQTQLQQLDNVFSDTTSGLAPAIDQFFAGINALAANPADASTRQSALSGAQALVGRFHQIDDQLVAMRTSANDRISSSVQTVNGITSQIASLNRRILEADSADGSVRPNDLLDQRDQLVAKLNEEIGAHAVAQNNGSYNVFLSNGQAVVVGEQATALAAVPDAADPANLQVALKTGTALLRFRSSDFSGGALAGTLTFRDQYLTDAQNALGRIAVALGSTFNAQHALGQDLNGALGTNFFGVSVPTVVPASTNGGTGAISANIADATALTGSDYRVQYDGTNYLVTRLGDGTTQSFASLPQTVDGIAIALASGTPAAGDAFTIQPTRTGARDLDVAIHDIAKVAVAGPVRTGIDATNAGTGTISAGRVDASFLTAPLTGTVTLTYASGPNQLTGFPATLPVTVTAGGVTTTYAAGAPVPYTPDATIAFGGISFVVSGTPANGDTFTVARNIGGIGDGRNAQALAGLAVRNMVGGTTSYQGAYASLVGSVGGTTQQIGVENDAQSALLAQAQAAQSASSGVNLDEEAANLQRYQQAYQAAGKLIAIGASLFKTILDLGT